MENRPTLANLIVETIGEDELRVVLAEQIAVSPLRVRDIAAYCGVGENALRKLLAGQSNAPSAITMLRLMTVLPGFAQSLGFKATDCAA